MALATKIDEGACLGLLTGATFGRVALSAGAGAAPRIVPVSFSVHPRGRISAHLQCDGDLAEALDGADVAFQADGFDHQTHQVWNVHIVGRIVARAGSDFVLEPGAVEGGWLDL
jgi:hypothetical protein